MGTGLGAAFWCDIGQARCDSATSTVDSECEFEGHTGQCALIGSTPDLFCNIWPLPEHPATTAEPTTTSASGCKDWCPGNSHSWKQKCAWKSCKSCVKCTDGCQSWCPQNSSPWSTTPAQDPKLQQTS